MISISYVFPTLKPDGFVIFDPIWHPIAQFISDFPVNPTLCRLLKFDQVIQHHKQQIGAGICGKFQIVTIRLK